MGCPARFVGCVSSHDHTKARALVPGESDGPASVDAVLRAVAFVPSPPLLVPELTGRGVPEAEAVRAAASTVAEELGRVAQRWVVLATGESDCTLAPSASGSFSGFGVDVPVTLSPEPGEPDAYMPLPALIAGYLRGRSAPEASVEARFVAVDTTFDRCVEHGRRLREEMDAEPLPWALLVVGDGATTLTAKAPGAFDERAEGVQAMIDDALAAADFDALAALDRVQCASLGVSGVAAWQTSVGVVGASAVRPHTLYRGAPFGVGYYVGSWSIDTEMTGRKGR